MPTFAAVDIGANSVRLKLATLARRRLKTVHEDREVTRLGASVFRTGLLDPEAMARTVKVLERFRKATRDADAVRVVATSALRDARNRQAFVDWVRAATGWRLEIITGLEEGRLIHLGLTTHSRLGDSPLLLIDLGGGSCELTVSEGGHIRQMYSLPLGAVRLTGEFLHHDPPKKKELARMREFIAEEVSGIAGELRSADVGQVVATSGTAAALTGAAASWRGTRSAGVPRRMVSRLAARLAKLTIPERNAIPGIGTRRAEIIVAGAAVFDILLQQCALGGFRYSPLGLRDGLLGQMAAEHDRSAPVHKRLEAQREDAIAELCRRYRADLKHGQQVRETATQLFKALRPLHLLPADYQDWLRASAVLHQLGSFVNRTGRHRHTYYLIANSEIFGFTPRERRLIATIARFSGGSRPNPASKAMGKIRASDFVRVRKAVCLLRLAHALNQGRRGAVTNIRARIDGASVRLRLVARGGAELELWALGKERAYFREVFGRELQAEIVGR